MPASVMIGLLLGYIGLLFVCAFVGERQALRWSSRAQQLLFGLTLAVYCSSWTFYGATGAAVRDGILYVPIYLGPLLMLWLGFDIWQRLGRIRQQQGISSIADFIAARYGKSGGLAAAVTLFSVLAIVPYLAQQLSAIDQSSQLVLAGHHSPQLIHQSIWLLTGLLSLLAIWFATRDITPSRQHNGLMLAVAAESLVKLFALLAVAGYWLWHSPGGSREVLNDVQRELASVRSAGLPAGFWSQTLLAALALICLPRQFHVSVVELRDHRHLPAARRWFSGYLVLVMLAILPLSSWALHHAQSPVSPDLAVLALPLQLGQLWLTALAFLGGFSAATGMLLVASLALAMMLTNDVIMPALWRLGWLSPQDAHMGRILKWLRGGCIVLIMAMGFGCYVMVGPAAQLSAFGLLAFSAVAQFAPALIGGLYWRRGSRHGVMAGLAAGFALWCYTLLLPSLVRYTDWSLGQHWLIDGPGGIYWLRPEALLGVVWPSALTHGVVWSLGANVVCFILVSRRWRPSLREQLQAEPFFLAHQSARDATGLMTAQMPASRVPVADLIALCSRIVGEQQADSAFRQFAQQQGIGPTDSQRTDARYWQFAEQLLAGAMGTASARMLLASVLHHDGLTAGQIAHLLDQSSQWSRFQHNLMLTMMDHISQGVSVVDGDLRLVAWNQPYMDLFDYPPELVYIGCPVADLIRFNAQRGDCGPGAVEEHVRKRLHFMQQGSSYQFERLRADGRVLQIRGNPVPGGGYVTTFADITAFKQTEAMLAARVSERTQQLEQALQEQQIARQQADQANQTKSRFLAAASHDLLQPMHAARLFSAALQHADLPAEDRRSLDQLDRALYGAETMLSALLEIARLDHGRLTPQVQPYQLQGLLDDFTLQFAHLAEQRGLQLRIHPTRYWVMTDPQWLRRILQNLISNALRYTAHGRVVVGVRRSMHPDLLRIVVADTGPGMAADQQHKLFMEFERGGHVSPWGEQGLGLGLAIVQRMTQQLGYGIRVQSRVGSGSCFEIDVPLHQPVTPAAFALPQKTSNRPDLNASGQTLRILCLDNDPAILDAMHTLLKKWQHQPLLAGTPDEALVHVQRGVDVCLIDQHLDNGHTGLDYILTHQLHQLPCALLTADSDPELPQRLKGLNITLLKKPLKPAALRAFLQAINCAAPPSDPQSPH